MVNMRMSKLIDAFESSGDKPLTDSEFETVVDMVQHDSREVAEFLYQIWSDLRIYKIRLEQTMSHLEHHVRPIEERHADDLKSEIQDQIKSNL